MRRSGDCRHAARTCSSSLSLRTFPARTTWGTVRGPNLFVGHVTLRDCDSFRPIRNNTQHAPPHHTHALNTQTKPNHTTDSHHSKLTKEAMSRRAAALQLAPLLLFLLFLLLEALAPADAAKLLRKKPHNAVASTTPTATDSDTTSSITTTNDEQRPRTRPRSHNVTVTQEENGVLINATMPSECLPVEQRCMTEQLDPLMDLAHNGTASDEEKNASLQDFCASECGQKYVEAWAGAGGVWGFT